MNEPVDVVEGAELGAGDLERHRPLDQLRRRHEQTDGAMRDPLVQIELHLLTDERHGVGVPLVPPRKRVPLDPSLLLDQRGRPLTVRRIDQEVDVAELPPRGVRVVEVGRRAALQHDGRDAVRREQGGDGEKVMFELDAAAHRGALQLTDVRSRGCRPGRSVCCRPPDRATARRDPSAPSTATRSSRPGSAPPGPNGRPPPAGAWRGAQARSRRSSSVSATRMAALASSRSRVGTSGNTSASR